MTSLPKYKFFKNDKSDTLDIVLNGMDFDMDSPFIKSVVDVCKQLGHSVLSFNYPFTERGEDHSSGPELREEKLALRKLMQEVQADGYKTIRLVGKSLGAIVAGEFLKAIPKVAQKKFTLIVLGYPTKYMDISPFTGKIYIIQGEKDKNGSVAEVKKHLTNTKSKSIEYFEVKGADHSFRDPITKEPIYENEALNLLSSID